MTDRSEFHARRRAALARYNDAERLAHAAHSALYLRQQATRESPPWASAAARVEAGCTSAIASLLADRLIGDDAIAFLSTASRAELGTAYAWASLERDDAGRDLDAMRIAWDRELAEAERARCGVQAA